MCDGRRARGSVDFRGMYGHCHFPQREQTLFHVHSSPVRLLKCSLPSSSSSFDALLVVIKKMLVFLLKRQKRDVT